MTALCVNMRMLSDGIVHSAFHGCRVAVEVLFGAAFKALRACAAPQVTVFRHGGVPAHAVQAIAAANGFTEFVVVKKRAAVPSSVLPPDAAMYAMCLRLWMCMWKSVALTARHGWLSCSVKLSVPATSALGSEEAGQVAPGQMTVHYAPDNLSTFLVSAIAPAPVLSPPGAGAAASDETATEAAVSLRSAIVLDFGGALAELRPHVRQYLDLSPKCADASPFMPLWRRWMIG